MDADDLLDIVFAEVKHIAEIDGLYLSGSRGSGRADEFSDFDFVAVAKRGNIRTVADRWEAVCRQHFDVVFCRKQVGESALVNVITDSWSRIDLYVENDEAFRRRAQSNLNPTFERLSLFEKLDQIEGDLVPSAQKLEYIVNEFLRVLGLLAVGAGRNELFLCRIGLGHLHNLFMSFVVEVERRKEGGALNLRRSVAKTSYEMMEGLPCAGRDQKSVVDAHIEAARLFFGYAKPVFAEMALDWPQAFEDATRVYLVRILREELRF